MADTVTAYRTCPLCEATCGLEITLDDGHVSGIRGDADDVFSHGFICPKGFALKALEEDSDRVRTPLLRTKAGLPSALPCGILNKNNTQEGDHDEPGVVRLSRPFWSGDAL